MDKINVLIVDDHLISSLGIKSMLAHDDSINVIGYCNCGVDALEFVKNNQVDVVLLDIIMAEMDGFEVLQNMRAFNPGQKVIMLTISDDKETIIRALSMKVNGFMLKDVLSTELIESVKEVNRGQYYYCQKIHSIIINEIFEMAEQKIKSSHTKNGIGRGAKSHSLNDLNATNIKSKLTQREYDILCLIGKGLSTKEISEKFSLSVFTVNAYRKNLYTKLGIKNLKNLVKLSQKENEFMNFDDIKNH